MNRTLREELLAHCQAAEGIRMLDPEEAAAFVVFDTHHQELVVAGVIA